MLIHYSKKGKVKSFQSHTVALFYSPQPDTCQSCKTMDMGPVCHTMCLYTPSLC